MLQKELNLLQEQPRKEEKTPFREKCQSNCAKNEVTSQNIQTKWEGGVILDCFYTFSSSVGLCNNQSQIWNTIWTGLVLKDYLVYLSTSELKK